MNTAAATSRTQHCPPPTPSVISAESSIEKLIQSWHRREQWRVFLTGALREDDSERAPWRTKLAHFLESTQIRIIAIFLLIVDLILTILELSSSLVSCSPKMRKHERSGKDVAYHWAGIVILSLLLARTVALVVALGRSFLRRPGCVVDGVVIAVALALEAFKDSEGGGLVVVVSLWRVVRVVESAFELSDEAIEMRIEDVVFQFEAIREENVRLLKSLDEKDIIIQSLTEQLHECC